MWVFDEIKFGTAAALRRTLANLGLSGGSGLTQEQIEEEFNLTPGVKVYRALLTQTGTDAPVATVLENSLGGTVVWTRVSTGLYLGTLAGAFPATKTWLNLRGRNPDDVNQNLIRESDNAVRVASDGDDGQLTNHPVEILVYP